MSHHANCHCPRCRDEDPDLPEPKRERAISNTRPPVVAAALAYRQDMTPDNHAKLLAAVDAHLEALRVSG